MIVPVYGALVPCVNMQTVMASTFAPERAQCRLANPTRLRMHIRPIEPADVAAVAALFRSLAAEFIVHESSPDAAATFLRDNDEQGFLAYLRLGHAYHVAEIDGELAGFIAVRERQHLYHMFVARQFHRRGVARALWDVARRAAIVAGSDGSFTVNASNYALPVYQALGFERTAPMQCVNGLYFNPMKRPA
jgi:ribosomal protein S18 acetylase RimI-like enzyme